jgi:hypothetical protein
MLTAFFFGARYFVRSGCAFSPSDIRRRRFARLGVAFRVNAAPKLGARKGDSTDHDGVYAPIGACVPIAT